MRFETGNLAGGDTSSYSSANSAYFARDDTTSAARHAGLPLVYRS